MAKSLSIASFTENLINGKYSKTELVHMKTNLINNYSVTNHEKIEIINAYLIGLDKLAQNKIPESSPEKEIENLKSIPVYIVTDDDVVNKYCQLRESAKGRGLDFSLLLKDIKSLLSKKKCYYTGISFGVGDLHRTIDRIDNNKGYITGNVVACTHAANQFKNQVFESKTSATFRGNLKIIKKIVATLETIV